MTPTELKRWRLSLPHVDGQPVNRRQAADMLGGVPYSTYNDWEAGRRRIPRMLPLACIAVTNGWRERHLVAGALEKEEA